MSLSSCSEWDTDSLGASFTPANSQVRNYTHLVYVEYTDNSARVWGPAAHEVTSDIQGQHVSLKSESDSLALFVYGYAATHDSLGISDGTLTIESPRPFALYLNGISLRSQNGSVISASNTCHLVLPSSTKNQLYGSIDVHGGLTLSGKGALTIQSNGTCISADSLYCQYEVTVNLTSLEADGISLSRGSMHSTMGTWNINAAQSAIHVEQGNIYLLAGTYQGTAREGSFLEAVHGSAYVRCPTLTAASAFNNDIEEYDKVAEKYDSVQYVWEGDFPDLTLEADSTYQITSSNNSAISTKFTPRQTIAEPWILLSNASILATDTLLITK